MIHGGNPMTNHPPAPTAQSTDWLSIIKVLNSKQRLQTLFQLFIYQEISLSELSSRLNRTKNTTVYHMKLLVESGLIIEIDKPVV